MVILKLKQHGIPGPQGHIEKPDWLKKRGPGNYQQMRKAGSTSYLANGTYSKVMGMKM
jgi:hypothetical protein